MNLKKGSTMSRYPRQWSYAVVVGVAMPLFLTGCGGSSGESESTSTTGGQATAPGTATQGKTKPCDLLTIDELEAATGFPVQAGQPTVQAGVSRCEWPVEYGSTGDATVSVDLTAGYPSGEPDDPSRWVDVSGVGDEAVWSMDFTELYVHTAQLAFSMHVGVSDDATQQVIAKTLALKVLERL